jgi:hypothetical protein
LGRALYSSVFAGAVGDALGRARTLAHEREDFLRLAISAQSPKLLELPWEYLHNDTGFLIQQPKTHIVRVIDELPRQMASFRPFTRVLVAIANPADKTRFDSDEHMQRIRSILTPMGVDIIELAAATYNTLFEKIEHEEFDAFYFLGHGQLNPDGGGDIFLEDGLSSAAMPATVLAQRLNQARPTSTHVTRVPWTAPVTSPASPSECLPMGAFRRCLHSKPRSRRMSQ